MAKFARVRRRVLLNLVWHSARLFIFQTVVFCLKWSVFRKKGRRSYLRSFRNSKCLVCIPIASLIQNVTLKFWNYSIGANIRQLIDRPDGTYCFRERKDRVYYVSEKILGLAQTAGPSHLISAGTCFGKFTKSNKFILHITALNYMVPYAKHKIWLKSSAEQQYLYGHHVLKSG